MSPTSTEPIFFFLDFAEIMSEKISLSSPSLERADTLNERAAGYDDVDVFGHEEEHDVRRSILPCPQ